MLLQLFRIVPYVLQVLHWIDLQVRQKGYQEIGDILLEHME